MGQFDPLQPPARTAAEVHRQAARHRLREESDARATDRSAPARRYRGVCRLNSWMSFSSFERADGNISLEAKAYSVAAAIYRASICAGRSVQCMVDMSGISVFGMPMVVASGLSTRAPTPWPPVYVPLEIVVGVAVAVKRRGCGARLSLCRAGRRAERRRRGHNRVLDGHRRGSVCRPAAREAKAAQDQEARRAQNHSLFPSYSRQASRPNR